MVLPSDDPNIRYIEKHFSVCRDEKVIDDVRSRVAVYEDSIFRYHKMVEIAAYKDSLVRKLTNESNEIKTIIVIWLYLCNRKSFKDNIIKEYALEE